MNYKLNMTLIGSFHIEGNRWSILVDRGQAQFQRYVLATYISGSDEWQSGRYFSVKYAAVEAFANVAYEATEGAGV